MEVLDNRCPACSAKITFNPKNQTWDCEYCGSKFTLEEMQKHKNASSKESNKVEEMQQSKNMDGLDVYHCKSCGAEIIADENTTATFCVYCGNTAILKSKIDNSKCPNLIIPFKKVKEDAVTSFKEVTKHKLLMPRCFKNEENIQKITGVYIPFWAYDIAANGTIEFTSTDVKTWSDYNYHYTKTDIYETDRSGSMSFDKIIVDGSSRFDDDLMDSIEPFDYSGLAVYNHAYLSGFLAEKYDVGEKDSAPRAEKRAMQTTIDVMKQGVNHGSTSVKTNNMALTTSNTNYIMLPVWMVNIKYKEKMYTFAMNGQTGKIVGNIPIDVPKAIIIGILIFTITFIICLVVSMMV